MLNIDNPAIFAPKNGEIGSVVGPRRLLAESTRLREAIRERTMKVKPCRRGAVLNPF